MTNRSRNKGTAAETDVNNYVNESGTYAHRNALSGSLDKGDITIPLLPGNIIVEVKNEKKMTLSEYVDEANVEAENAKALFGVAWHKRRGKVSPANWYVTMDGKTFMKIIEAIKTTHPVIS